MKITATCIAVQKYRGYISVDSGKVTTDEVKPVSRIVEGRTMQVLEPVSPAGPGHPIHVNEEHEMFRVNFSFQDAPLLGDLTVTGLLEHDFEEGGQYDLSIG